MLRPIILNDTKANDTECCLGLDLSRILFGARQQENHKWCPNRLFSPRKSSHAPRNSGKMKHACLLLVNGRKGNFKTLKQYPHSPFRKKSKRLKTNICTVPFEGKVKHDQSLNCPCGSAKGSPASKESVPIQM